MPNDRLNYLLSSYPNPMMTASEFLEKFIAQYFTYNNAFIYIQWDEFTGSIKAVYPLDFPLFEHIIFMLDLLLVQVKELLFLMKILFTFVDILIAMKYLAMIIQR